MESQFLLFVFLGFVAQIIDGALGMAYGVSANTFLLSIGVPPAAASASVHLAEVFTTGISGLSHWRLGNIEKELIKKLLIPGVIGGSIGAYILTSIPGDRLKPFIAVYLLVMGVIVLRKAFDKNHRANQEVNTYIAPLGLVGGFFDAIGGGGWGPIVTTTLVARGKNPRFSIGSVNMTEFFVTLSESIVFLVTIGLTNWQISLGLLLGGGIAAPIAALVTKKMRPRPLMGLVGILIIALSIRTIILAF